MIQILSVGLLDSRSRSAVRKLSISIQNARTFHAWSRLDVNIRCQHLLGHDQWILVISSTVVTYEESIQCLGL